MAKRVILDVDTGIDDAIAVMLALRSPELEVVAITTVSGNVHVSKTSVNTLKVLEVMGARVPVARGMDRPLVKPLYTAEDVHGSDGLGELGLPPPKLGLDPRHAVDLIIEEASEHPGDVTVITTGPMTNLAVALLKRPELADEICEVISMAGAFHITPYGYGNVTPVAEYNVWVDPEAARAVLQSGVKLTFVGLDVTMDPEAGIGEEEIRLLEESGDPAAVLAARLSRFYLRRMNEELMRMHDPLAVAIAADPGLAERRKYPIYIDTRDGLTRGITVADRRTYKGAAEPPHGSAYVCVSVRGKKFKEALLKRLRKGVA